MRDGATLKNVGKVVVLLLLVIGFAMLALELWARNSVADRKEFASQWGQLWIGHDDPDVLMDTRLKPNVTITYTGMWVPLEPTTISINSYGFRDREFDVSKPADVKRIIFLGGSHTFGQGVEIEQTYPKLLESTLNEETGQTWEVLNFGVPGWFAKQKQVFFEGTGLQFSPDIVVFHINDGDNTDDSILLKNHPELVEEMQALQEKDSAIAWHRARSIEQKLYIELRHEISPPDWSNLIPSLERLAELGQQQNFTFIVMYSEGNPVKEAIDLLGKRDDMLFLEVDAGKARLGYDARELFCIHPDDCHPNEEGHEVFSQIISNYLLQTGNV